MSPQPERGWSTFLYTYTAAMVATLLERRLEATDDLDLIEYFADLDAAMEVLGRSYPGCYRLALAYAEGHHRQAWAEESHTETQMALDAIFQALALVMNGDAPDA